MLVRTLI